MNSRSKYLEYRLVKNIISKRKELNVTQQQIADVIGVPQSTIARFEAQLVSPRLETIIKICDYLNMKLCVNPIINNKIMIVGPSGAGKSCFSKKLADILNLPLYHLDNIWWKEDKTHISKEDFDGELYKILKNDKWIIDGDYSRTYEMRMNACDTIIFLDYPLELCLAGAKERIGKKRDDLPWIEDELDAEFKEWIINWEKDTLPKLELLLDKYKETKEIYVFKTRNEANEYLKVLGAKFLHDLT
ncbi:MAG: helix-turn-helix domain-containing protein [Clostridia bacterium]|nr:helix-turn-helix domain-containing protein [Clostridia bacterium]